ncbi:Fic family protein [Catenovulum agarivorans]|uniref:Fic family protein n=1 Tax=Catenovulum agarivorans TaxID=1172192 RepID=UPI001F4405B7|nr:Fic family protein [Catenovulum agarivorans]
MNKQKVNELLVLKERFNLSLLAIMEKTKRYTANLDLLKIWPETKNLPDLFNQLSELKACLDGFRPFNSSMVEALNKQLDIKYTYESNCIEGNSLTLNETEQVINTGLTIGGKPLVDHLEAINHQEAIYYIRDLATRDIEISIREIQNIHALVLKGIDDQQAGRFRKHPVFVMQEDGSKHEFPQPFILEKLMEDFMLFFNNNKTTMHPVEMAAHLHQKLVNIHPFIDGNGRTSRLLMNLYLFQNGYPVTVIDSEMSKRKEYYSILSNYDGVLTGGDSQPFQLFVAQKTKESLIEQLNFFAQDTSDESSEKGYLFFKKVEPLLVQNKS